MLELATAGSVARDGFRYFIVIEGVSLMVVSLHATVYAYRHGWPRRIKAGLTFRWLGRLLMVAFMTFFTISRLHEPLNWYSPVIFGCFTFLNVGMWLTKDLVYRAEDKAVP